MSIEAMSFVLNTSLGNGKSVQKLVLLGFANHADRLGKTAYPSIATVAQYADCHELTVKRHVKWLIEHGYLREGDQRHVQHLRSDRRPVVYDVAVSEETVLSWAADPSGQGTRSRHAENGAKRTAQFSRGNNSLPRENQERGNNLPSRGMQSVASGVTDCIPEPSLEPSLEPHVEQSVLDVGVGLNSSSPTGDERSKTDPDEGCRFDEFWSIYPRRTGKGQARAAWRKAIRKTTVDVILKGAMRYRDDPNREQPYTKHPATWLNGECWDDDLLPAKGGSALPGNGYWPEPAGTLPAGGSSYWPT